MSNQFNSVQEALAAHPDAVQERREKARLQKAEEEEKRQRAEIKRQCAQEEYQRKQAEKGERNWQELLERDPLGTFMRHIKEQLENNTQKQQEVLSHIRQTGSDHVEISYDRGWAIGIASRFFSPVGSFQDMERQLGHNGPQELTIEQGPFQGYIIRAEIGSGGMWCPYTRITLGPPAQFTQPQASGWCAIL